MLNFSAFVCLALLTTVVFAADKTCVTLFESNPEYFDVCRTTECFIFRTEIPIVWVPDTMNSIEHQKPFPCSNYKHKFKGLKGPFFDIVNAANELRNTLCVWGGTGCQFDDMVKFVRRSTRGGKHKFIAGGVLFLFNYRMSNHTIPSVPILDDQLIVIGPRDDAATTFARAWTAMWRPFSSRTWMFLFFITLSYTLVRGWIAFHFSDPWSWNRFHDNFLGEYDPEQVYSGPGRDGLPRVRNQAELRRLNTYLSYSFKMGFVIVFLFYEISLVDFVFSQSREQMDELDPSQFVITGNTTQERKFKEYIESQEFGNCLGGNNEPCWKQVGSIAQVYTNITSQGGKKPDRYRYSAVYETLNRYWFKKNSSLCKELQVLDYAELNRPFMGVWYYSSNIPQARRTEMDMAIAELREDDKIRGFLHNVSGSKLPANCENSSSIDYLQLGMPLVTCSGPIFCAVLVYMCLSTIPWRNRSVNKKTKDSVNNDEGEKDPESQTDVRAISKCKLDSLD